MNDKTPAANPVDKSNEVLENAKGKFNNVVVIGFNDKGGLDIVSTINQYPFLHWVLNKSIFELSLHEKNTQLAQPDDTSD